MKRVKIVFMIAFVLFFSGNAFTVWADDNINDDDHSKHGEYGEFGEENELFEEGGDVLGWGTIVLAGLAGVLFPLRRSGKHIRKKFPNMKNSLVKLMKFFGKWHIVFGVLALLGGATHGVLMYLDEGELGLRELLGVGGVALVSLAAVLGIFLARNKKLKTLRSAHILLISTAAILAAVHVLS